MNSSALALIMASPDSLRYSLRALLSRLPQIAEVRDAVDTRSLLAALPELQPRLVVLDANLLRLEAAQALNQVKTASPQSRIVVLVDQIEQQQALQANQADHVLLKGYPAADLFASLESLLTRDEQSADS